MDGHKLRMLLRQRESDNAAIVVFLDGRGGGIKALDLRPDKNGVRIECG